MCMCTQMHGAREIEIYLPVLVFVIIIFTPNARNLFVSLILQIFICKYHILKIHVFILFFGHGGSSLLHVGFSLVAARQGLLTSCSAWTHCGGFSCCGAQAQGVWA